MERWLAVEPEGELLGTLRCWEEIDPRTQKQAMSIFVPSEQDPSVMEEFRLDMVQEMVRNQFVIAETDKDSDNPANRASKCVLVSRMVLKYFFFLELTQFSGRVKHEVNVRPKYNADYSDRMRARVAAASEPARQIKMIEDSMGGARGNINMLSSGANQRTSSFDSLVVSVLFMNGGVWGRVFYHFI